MRRNEQIMMMDLKSFIFSALKDCFYLCCLVLGVFFVDVRTEMDEDEDNVQDDSRTRGDRRVAAHAQYVSVNCVVFTHYTGDVANVVDEHFSRALNSDQKLNNAHQTSTKGESLRSFDLNFNAINKVRIHNKIWLIQRIHVKYCVH